MEWLIGEIFLFGEDVFASFLTSAFSSVAIESPLAAAFFFSLALTFAVVDKTTVVTLATASFLGGFVMEGYANKLGPAFDIGALRSAFR